MKVDRRPLAGGFTLVELLVIVAIVGILASILIPNLLDSLQKGKQKRTVADMRDVGVAWFSWLTDQTSAAAGATTKTFNFEVLTETLTAGELHDLLFISDDMFYTRSVPSRDGWAFNFQYRWSGDPSSAQVIGIRSLGRDGQEGPTTNPYPAGPFVTTEYEEDIIWSDGYFIRYPLGVRSQ